MTDSQYMVLPTVSKQAVGRHNNPQLWNTRTGKCCRWQDLPENRHLRGKRKEQQRVIIPAELLESGEACKIKCDNRWHRGRIWFFSNHGPRVWVVVYPYSTCKNPEPFPLLVDLDEELVGLPGDGAAAPGEMPAWAV